MIHLNRTENFSSFSEFKKHRDSQKKKRISSTTSCKDLKTVKTNTKISELRNNSDPNLKKEKITPEKIQELTARHLLDHEGFQPQKPVSLNLIIQILNEEWEENELDTL